MTTETGQSQREFYEFVQNKSIAVSAGGPEVSWPDGRKFRLLEVTGASFTERAGSVTAVLEATETGAGAAKCQVNVSIFDESRRLLAAGKREWQVEAGAVSVKPFSKPVEIEIRIGDPVTLKTARYFGLSVTGE